MRAIAVVPGQRELKLIDQEPPRLQGPNDVKLRMLEAGVCGTDREICAFEYGTPPQGLSHLVIGHESLGEVVEVGSAVTRVGVGDLVVPTVRRPCPHDHCRPCRSGRQDFCSTGDFRERGIRELPGFMTEQVVDHEQYMNVVPRELRDVAVLVEPLTIAEKGLLQLARVQERLPWGCAHAQSEGFGHCHRAIVIGGGPVGLLGAMALTVAGFQTTVCSREPSDSPRADLVRSFGAQYASATEEDVEKMRRRIGPVDVVYEAVGLAKLGFEALSFLGPNGVVILTGVPALKGPASIDLDPLMRNLVLGNQVVLGTVNAGRDAFEGAIRDLGIFHKRWPAAVKALITGRYPMEAHRDLLLGRPSGIKDVITLEAR